MATLAIADYYKYANLQMAAEAFLVDIDVDGKATLKGDLKEALIEGNNHASKFTEQLADDFLAHWEVVTQCPNTETGFSGARRATARPKRNGSGMKLQSWRYGAKFQRFAQPAASREPPAGHRGDVTGFP